MDFLGIVEEITTDGRAIVRSKSLPDLGDRVLDSKERPVGTVKKIFGPVDSPYVAVSLEKDLRPESMKNKELYYTKGTHYGKDKRRNRRN